MRRVSRVRLCRIMFAALLAGASHAAFSGDKVVAYVDPTCVNHKDGDILGSTRFAGKLTGFVWGDYLHAEFVDGGGRPLSLFIQTNDVSCFLALHKDDNLKVSYQTICRYMPEGAGIYPTEEITQVNAGKVDLVSWRKKFDRSKDGEACVKLERKYTRER